MEITDEDGQLMLDGELLPGLFEGLEVEGALDIDDQQVPGASDVSRQVHGFKPAAVVFKLLLPTDDESTAIDKLRTITRRFRETDGVARPFIRRVVSPQLAVWGVDEVLFTQLRHTDEGKIDVIKVELRFEEWRPSARRRETMVGSTAPDLNPELQRLLGFGITETGTAHPTDLARQDLMTDVIPAPW